MQKFMKIILSLICLVLLTGCQSVSAHEKTGSINIELEDGWTDTLKEDVEFTVTRIGHIIDGEYHLIDDLKNLDIDLNEIETAEILQKDADFISDKIKDMDLEKIQKKTNKQGQVSFDDLEVGIYLVENTDRKNYDNVSSTLIAVPTYMEKGDYVNSMNYDIKVIPKHSPVIKIEISKQDITTSKELEGAKLTLTDKDKNVVDEWVSGKKPHLIKDLLPGSTYILTEVTAPENYQLAQSIEFTVKDTGDIQKIVMYDEPVSKTKTGDDTNILLYGGLFFGSLGFIVLIAVKYLKKD